LKRFRFVPGRSRGTVTVRAPGHSFSADTVGIEGELELDDSATRLLRVDARCPLAALDAHDTLKNHELRRFLDLDRRPTATAELVGEVPLERIGSRLVGRGQIRFELRGRSVNAAIDLSGEVEQSPAKARASFTLTFTGLGYDPPKLLFLKVKDSIEVAVDAELNSATPP
jgi:hypothetical protein